MARKIRAVMPERYHKHDERWIDEQLNMVPVAVGRARIAHAYSDAYREAYDAEPVEHKKDNTARRSANTRLRVYIERIYSAEPR